MLTVDRKIGESVHVGRTVIVVKDIKDRSVLVEVGDLEYRIKHGQSVKIGDAEVFLIKFFNNKVRLGFSAHRSIRILRSELLDEGESLKYIDNSTKQFPSGDY